jgi:NitT/TauT family transport system ATP-binding protein
MANISFNAVERVFHQGDKEIVAVGGVTLEVADREFVAIVGPRAVARPPACVWQRVLKNPRVAQ